MRGVDGEQMRGHRPANLVSSRKPSATTDLKPMLSSELDDMRRAADQIRLAIERERSSIPPTLT
jgi:hypothetical protein